MARPASVFVRALSVEEAQRLRRVSRHSRVFALRQRAQIVLASDARSTAPEIARVLQTDENQVRRVIAEFNADGMESLRPRIGGGCPRRIDDAARDRHVVLCVGAIPCSSRRPTRPDRGTKIADTPGHSEEHHLSPEAARLEHLLMPTLALLTAPV